MKLNSFLPIALIAILFVFSSCDEEKYADWKILNDNKTADEMAAKKSDNNYVITQSGLCYRILYPGNMKQATINSYVKVQYTGTLITGKVFDSGTFYGSLVSSSTTSGTIKAWQEAIPKLKVGGKMEMIVPYDLGYGSSASGVIPAYSLLYFTVELLDAQY
jgi:FKBP-type peptidyl-prolyl cis-trans isomerase